jgi:fluoride exporter
MLEKALYLALAGALGTLARVGVGAVAQAAFGPRFPWATVTVNVLGCFLFGLFWMLGSEHGRISAEQRFIILVGFMGAFTTFSSFVSDSLALAGQERWWAFGLNVVGQNAVGLACFLLGARLGRAALGQP